MKYLGVVFTRDRTQNKDFDTWSGTKQMQFCVSLIAHRTVVSFGLCSGTNLRS